MTTDRSIHYVGRRDRSGAHDFVVGPAIGMGAGALPIGQDGEATGLEAFDGGGGLSAEHLGGGLDLAADELPGDPLNKWKQVFSGADEWLRGLPASAFPTEAPRIARARLRR